MIKPVSTLSIIVAGVMCVVPTFGAQMTPQIQRLLDQKQEKIKKLEECEGKKQGWMIAGISTIGVTAVGVGLNIAQASKRNRLDDEIDTARHDLEKKREDLSSIQNQIAEKERERAAGNEIEFDENGNIVDNNKPQTPSIAEAECAVFTEKDDCIESEKCTWKNDRCIPNIIGQQCGADAENDYTGYGTWVQAEGGRKECFVKNNNSDLVNCLCIQSECINKKSYSIYQLKDETGETVPFANIKCDGLSSEGLDVNVIQQISSHATSFYGKFCIESTIDDNARCTIECIGYNTLTGTMKQLKDAIKDNSLTICSGAIRLDVEVEFGESCNQK